MADFEPCLLLRIRQNATIPPIRMRPTKPPTIAAIVAIFLREEDPDVYTLVEVLELDAPPAPVGGGPSSLSVLLAMFTSKISVICTFRSAAFANTKKGRMVPKRLDRPI